MTGTDDNWKGEHLLSIPRKTEVEQANEARSIMHKRWHSKRREAGDPPPAAKWHKAFRNSLFATMRDQD